MSVNGQGKKLVKNTDYTVSYSRLTIRSTKLKTIGNAEHKCQSNRPGAEIKNKIVSERIKRKRTEKNSKTYCLQKIKNKKLDIMTYYFQRWKRK